MGVKGVRKSGGHADGSILVSDLDSAIGDAVLQDTRLRLIAILGSAECHARGGYSLQELSRLIECSVQNIHHHLMILRRYDAVRVLRAEATQRIPRQFWISDVHHIRIVPTPGADLSLELGASAEGSA